MNLAGIPRPEYFHLQQKFETIKHTRFGKGGGVGMLVQKGSSTEFFMWFLIFLQTTGMCICILYIVILQIKLWESHWLFRRAYSSIFTVAAVYMTRMTSRKLHSDVTKTHYSWRHSKFFTYNFQTSGMFLSLQRLYCWVSAQLDSFSGLFMLD